MESETENGICSISSISSTISCPPVSGQRECYRHNRTISLASSCDEGSLMVGRVMLSQARKRDTQKYDPLFRSCDHHGSFMVQTLKHPRSMSAPLSSWSLRDNKSNYVLILACFFSLGKHLQRFKAEILCGQTCLKCPTQFPHNGCETGTFNWWYEP